MTGPEGNRRPIERLLPATIEKIAAGEVVERPAAVVKELVENAIDAGATEVRIAIDGGGLARVRVDDDGWGIPRDELPKALERHATSKLRSIDDLETIGTLGFRGEALAAIAAVARLTLTSRVPTAEEAWSIHADGGEVGPAAIAGRPVGTTVEVRDLFFNTPARRKFLKAPAAELVAIVRAVERLHLGRPDVALVLAVDGKEAARYPADRSLRDAAARVLGTEFLGQSFAVSAQLTPAAHLEAVLGRPVTARPTSTSLFVLVNGRSVDARPIAQAVRAAFLDYLPRTRFPVGVVAIRIDPRRVDVNVHPTKREVRLADEAVLVESLRAAVRGALLGSTHLALPHDPTGPRPSGTRADRPLLGTDGPRPPTIVATQRSLVGPTEASVLPTSSRHPELRLLGCVAALYWVAESPGGLVLVDQHAASERVLFDSLRRADRLARQELLAPARAELTARERTVLAAHAEDVAAAGFAVEPFAEGVVRVRTVPAHLARRAPDASLKALLAELADGGRPTYPDGVAERRTATIACHAAVRAGDVIEPETMRRILGRLEGVADGAYACPHGRPILVELPRARLDRWFLRAGA